MFAKRRITPHVYNFVPKGLVDYNKSEFYHPSNIDCFLCEKTKPPYDGTEAVTLTSDITMLFNQQRLDRMTREALIQHFDSMAVQNPKFSELRSKLTDDQLCSIVKSRYIQSPSELMAYSSYLVNAYGSELAAHVVPEPAPSPEPSPASAAE